MPLVGEDAIAQAAITPAPVIAAISVHPSLHRLNMEDDWCPTSDETRWRAVLRRPRRLPKSKPEDVRTGRKLMYTQMKPERRPQRPTKRKRQDPDQDDGDDDVDVGGGAPSTVVRIGSDCTGINTTHIALNECGFHVIDEFASEKEPATRKLLRHNFKVKHLAKDIFARDDASLPTGVDLYTAGPPCQSFSAAGLNAGIGDARGHVFVRVLQTIERTRPSTFIIENVANLPKRHRKFYEFALKQLQGMKDTDGTKTYKVRARIVDTKTIGGLPQSRPRMYIVGWQRKLEVAEPFQWPGEVPMRPLRELLDLENSHDAAAVQCQCASVQKNLEKASMARRLHASRNNSEVGEGLQCSSKGRPVERTAPLYGATCRAAPYWCSSLRAALHKHCIALQVIFVTDVGSSASRGGGRLSVDIVPCLTRSRCISGGHWLMNLNRKMTTEEMETLQAIPLQRLSLPPHMKARAYQGMLGNAFTVSVVGRIAVRLLRAIGLTTAVGDPWAGEAGG